MKLKLLFFFSAFILILISCSKEKTNDHKKLAEIYVNLLFLEETYPGQPDSLESRKLDLYKKYGMSENEYTNGINNFEVDKEAWEKFFDYSLVYLDSLRKERTASEPDTLKRQF